MMTSTTTFTMEDTTRPSEDKCVECKTHVVLDRVMPFKCGFCQQYTHRQCLERDEYFSGHYTCNECFHSDPGLDLDNMHPVYLHRDTDDTHQFHATKNSMGKRCTACMEGLSTKKPCEPEAIECPTCNNSVHYACFMRCEMKCPACRLTSPFTPIPVHVVYDDAPTDIIICE